MALILATIPTRSVGWGGARQPKDTDPLGLAHLCAMAVGWPPEEEVSVAFGSVRVPVWTNTKHCPQCSKERSRRDIVEMSPSDRDGVSMVVVGLAAHVSSTA